MYWDEVLPSITIKTNSKEDNAFIYDSDLITSHQYILQSPTINPFVENSVIFFYFLYFQITANLQSIP